MVAVRAVKSVKKPVSLANIKANDRLQDISLVRHVWLLVTPVSKPQCGIILKMGTTGP